AAHADFHPDVHDRDWTDLRSSQATEDQPAFPVAHPVSDLGQPPYPFLLRIVRPWVAGGSWPSVRHSAEKLDRCARPRTAVAPCRTRRGGRPLRAGNNDWALLLAPLSCGPKLHAKCGSLQHHFGVAS